MRQNKIFIIPLKNSTFIPKQFSYLFLMTDDGHKRSSVLLQFNNGLPFWHAKNIQISTINYVLRNIV